MTTKAVPQPQRTKIQIGISKVTPNQSSSDVKPSTNQQNETSALFSDTNNEIYSQSLFDICDPHFIKKNNLSKRKLTKGTTKTNKQTTTIKSSTVIKQNVGPSVEIVNGQIVIKESSLVAGSRSGTNYDDYEEVEEENYGTARYSSFTKRRPSPTWGIEETKLFYSALRQCGTDFTNMMAFFPGRTRRQLKLKYYREEKHHPDLIDYAINTSASLELAPFEAVLGDLTSSSDAAPPALDDDEDQEEDEHLATHTPVVLATPREHIYPATTSSSSASLSSSSAPAVSSGVKRARPTAKTTTAAAVSTKASKAMTKANQAKSKKAKSGKNKANDEGDEPADPIDHDLNDADYTGDEGEGEGSDDGDGEGDGDGHDTTAAGVVGAEDFYDV